MANATGSSAKKLHSVQQGGLDLSSPERCGFTREERLKKRDEIREVFGRGKRFGCRGAKLFVLKNGLSRNRICFATSRGYGNAVERNHARRLGREAYRCLKPRLGCGNDMILLVYPENSGSTFTIRMEQLRFLLGKAGLLR